MTVEIDTDRRLEDATSVVIYVHGVGDHTQRDTLREVEIGLSSLHATETRRQKVDVPEVLPAFERIVGLGIRGEDWAQTALVVGHGQSQHVVIPVDWSHLRPRADWAAAPFPDPLRYLSMGAVPLAAICVNAVRCAAKAKRFWKIPIAAIACVVVSIVAGMFVAVWYLSTQVGWWANPKIHFYYPLLAFLSLYLLSLALKRWYLPVIDFVGDVTFYLASVNRRADIEYRLRRFLEKVATLAPRANIVVICHSLGTVLVTHSLLTAKKALTHRRILLITMGSPLRWIARLFDGYVKSPSELLARFEQILPQLFWVNFWRDLDFIGRDDLRPDTSHNFAEKSLGSGGHTGMLETPILWRTIAPLIYAPEAGFIQSASAEWGAQEITTEESEEMKRKRQFLLAMGPLSLGALALLVSFGTERQSGLWFANADFRYRPLLRMASVGLASILSGEIILWSTAMILGQLTSKIAPNRARVGAIRRLSGVASALYDLSLYIVAAFALFYWLSFRTLP